MSDHGLEEDIAAYQAGWNIPPEHLDAVVRAATNAGVARDTRVFEGHGNEVHSIVTEDGDELVARIAWRAGPAFECERWPIDAVRAAGVRAPQILLIEHTTIDQREVSIQIQHRLPGRSVYGLFPVLTDEELTALSIEAGRQLATVHAISAPGWGPITPDGRVEASAVRSSQALLTAMSERTGYLVDAGFEQQLLDGCVELVDSSAGPLDEAPVALIHGDWRTTNLLSDGKSITGVDDWEGARGGDPAFDFSGAWKTRSRPQATAMDLVRQGYRDGGGTVDDAFQMRRRAYEVADLHAALAHYAATDRADLGRLALAELRSLLR